VFGKVKPLLKLLSGEQFPLSRWSLFSTIVRLAFLKRKKSTKNEVCIKLGSFKIFAPDYEILSMLIKEKFVEQEYYFICNLQSPVVVDCGSNIGISVLYFKSLYPDAVIHCFEPYSRAFYFLKKNIEVNNLKNIVLHNKALSNSSGTIELNIPANDNLINARINGKFAGGHTEIVRCEKLSDHLLSLGHTDLVKLDVEGSEIEILDDLNMSGLLNKPSIGKLIIEFHQSVIRDDRVLNRIIDSLRSVSYEVESKTLYPDVEMSDVLLRAQ
jgi:FkbM family methyltransferase